MISKEFTFTCELTNGMHARPASSVVNEVKPFDIEVTLLNQRNGRKVNAKSALSIISADISYRDVCTLKVTGKDADRALRKLRNFILRDLPEKEEVQVAPASSAVLPPSLCSLDMEYAQGMATGGGWARGAPVCLREYSFLPKADHAVYAGVTGERLRLVGALEQVQRNLKKAVEKAELVAEREVLNAHLTLACDPDFRNRLLDHVENGLSVVESIEATMEHFSHALKSGESTYLHDRVVDIRDLCDQLLHLSYGSGCLYSPDVLTHHSICLADNLTPSQFLALDKRYLNGLVLESGGKASHTVLIAQARGIPVVVGVEGARELMNQAREVILDARLGLLIANPSREAGRYYQQERRKQQQLKGRHLPFIKQKAHTLDGKAMNVCANIVSIDDAEKAFNNGAEGVGLFRTEMIYMERAQAPDEMEQLSIYSRIMELAHQRSVIIRTIDVGADKPVEYFQLLEEQNPFLGYRAIRLYPEFLEWFKVQVRAILRAARKGRLAIMIPMISCLDEVIWVRKVLEDARDELSGEGLAYGDVSLGIMLEVPSACLIVDQLARYVDFFSIGSNDLAQYFLAADRDNDRVSNLYSYLHPSFLRLLRLVTTEARQYERWIGCCGEMAADAEALPLLVGLGLNELSLPCAQIPAIKEKLSHLDSQECQTVLDQAISCKNIDDVKRILRNSQIHIADRKIFDAAIVNLEYDALTREEAIKELVDMMYLDGRLSCSREVEDAVWQREAIYSTGLGDGIAIPHLHSEHVLSHSVGILRLREPILWQCSEEQWVNTVFLLAVPDNGVKDQHMKVFAQLARKLASAAFMERFNQCDNVQKVVDLLQGEMERAELE